MPTMTLSPPPEALQRPPLPVLAAEARVALDDALSSGAHGRIARQPDGTREAVAVFALQGMHCAACAGLIEAALTAVAGVRSARVHAARERATVQWDPDRVRPSDLVDAVRRAGYTAVPATHEAAAHARRREARQSLWQLFVAGFCMMQVMMVTTPVYVAAAGEIPADQMALLRWSAWVMTLPVVLFSCGPFFSGAFRALRRGRLAMDVPVALGMAITFLAGTLGTFDPAGAFGQEVYLDSLAMFATFLLAGRWLERRARDRATEALEALLHRLPDSVERLALDGTAAHVPVSRLQMGDRVRVPAGQPFPGDGVVLEGHAAVDESLLSGEARPVARGVGDAVLAGSVNAGSPVVVQLVRLGADTRHGQILALLDQALTQRPAALRLADRIAGPFLAGVLLLAAGAGLAWVDADPARAVSIAVAVLIVTCPCALSLAAPAAWLAAAGTLARRGVLVQRLEALEVLAGVDTACVDKTGTLTCDALTLATTEVLAGEGPALLRAAATLAARSHHPLSRALAASLLAGEDGWSEMEEVPGRGLQGRDTTGRLWRLGSPAWAGVPRAGDAPQVACAPLDSACDGAARFTFDEVLRLDAVQAVAAMRADGLAVRMLSGDGRESADRVAARVGIDAIQAEASPDDKLAALAALQEAGRRVLMVGDGLNDGPVLARADVSFALAHGSALAQQRADFIVLGSRLSAVPEARVLARRMVRVTRQNLAWAGAYNLACVPLAVAGWLPAWAAGAGMALSSLVVVVNALRLSR